MKILKTIFGDGAGQLVESVGGVLDKQKYMSKNCNSFTFF